MYRYLDLLPREHATCEIVNPIEVRCYILTSSGTINFVLASGTSYAKITEQKSIGQPPRIILHYQINETGFSSRHFNIFVDHSKIP